jgi:hypothetical protein
MSTNQKMNAIEKVYYSQLPRRGAQGRLLLVKNTESRDVTMLDGEIYVSHKIIC